MGTFVKNTEVRDRIIQMLDSDVPWNRGWKPSCSVPHKTSGDPYSFAVQCYLRYNDEYVGKIAAEKLGFQVKPEDVEYIYFKDAGRYKTLKEKDPVTGKMVPVINPETGEEMKVMSPPVFTKVAVVAACNIPGYERHTFNEPPHPNLTTDESIDSFIMDFCRRQGLRIIPSLSCKDVTVDDKTHSITVPDIRICASVGHYYYALLRGIGISLFPQVARKMRDDNALELAADIFAAKEVIAMGLSPEILPADEKYRRKWARAINDRVDIFMMACSRAEKAHDVFYGIER